ncbi:unnamed protein product, partial [Anisakis simplex]|uniref:Ras-specific guanine nucleotide-releasing factor 1 n=1 Tax=Anisakis simplex TaxID=6269 RepID=A0A0M3KJC2_ANISI
MQKHSPPCCPTVDMPCFLLHFPADDSEQLRTPDKSKLLQVFSRQAVMMEAMNALYRIALLEATEEFSDVEYDEEKISEEQERNCNHSSVEQRVEIEVDAIAIEIKAEEDFEVYDEDPAEVNGSADCAVDPARHSKPSLESTTAAEIKLEDSTKQLAVNPKDQSAHAEESKNSDKSATISRDSAREMESQQRQPAKKPAPLQRFAAYVQQKISPSDEEGRSLASKTESKAVAGKGKRSDGDSGNHSAGSAGSSSGDSGTESNENNSADNTGSTGSRTPNGSRRNHLGNLKFLRGLKRRS